MESGFDPKAYVEKWIEKSKVVIFSATYCPYCRIAQKQFDKLDSGFKNKEKSQFSSRIYLFYCKLSQA